MHIYDKALLTLPHESFHILFNSLSGALQNATTALKKIRWPDTSQKDTMLMNDKNATN